MKNWRRVVEALEAIEEAVKVVRETGSFVHVEVPHRAVVAGEEIETTTTFRISKAWLKKSGLTLQQAAEQAAKANIVGFTSLK